MSEPLLAVLKLCLLALLYLFFLRVLRAVWAEVRGPRPSGIPAVAVGPPVVPVAVEDTRGRRERRRPPRQLVIVEPAEHLGRAFELSDELTVGRAAGCQVTVDDTFVSQLHARVFARDGQYFVEDLGSTNGTYLNRQKVGSPMPMRSGDRLQVGNTVLELT